VTRSTNYYLAAGNILFGEHAPLCANLYGQFGIAQPGRMDGVSYWGNADGGWTLRATVRDLFRGDGSYWILDWGPIGEMKLGWIVVSRPK
jgi:hypothetical protein